MLCLNTTCTREHKGSHQIKQRQIQHHPRSPRQIQSGGMYADLELELSVQNPVNNFLINLQRSYTEALEENLDMRFVEAPVLKAYGVFDPTTIPSKSETSFANYGNEDIPCLLSTSTWTKRRHLLSGKTLSTTF